MRMTVVIDEKGEGHAVLTLITDRGDLVLDNKTNNVLPWRQTGYTFIKRESQSSMAWVSLGRAASPVTTANRIESMVPDAAASRRGIASKAMN